MVSSKPSVGKPNLYASVSESLQILQPSQVTLKAKWTAPPRLSATFDSVLAHKHSLTFLCALVTLYHVYSDAP